MTKSIKQLAEEWIETQPEPSNKYWTCLEWVKYFASHLDQSYNLVEKDEKCNCKRWRYEHLKCSGCQPEVEKSCACGIPDYPNFVHGNITCGTRVEPEVEKKVEIEIFMPCHHDGSCCGKNYHGHCQDCAKCSGEPQVEKNSPFPRGSISPEVEKKCKFCWAKTNTEYFVCEKCIIKVTGEVEKKECCEMCISSKHQYCGGCKCGNYPQPSTCEHKNISYFIKSDITRCNLCGVSYYGGEINPATLIKPSKCEHESTKEDETTCYKCPKPSTSTADMPELPEVIEITKSDEEIEGRYGMAQDVKKIAMVVNQLIRYLTALKNQ